MRTTDPQPLPQQTLSDVARWLGERGDWKSAKDVVDLRLQSHPNSSWAHYAAAEVYRRLGDTDRAKELYKESLRLLPNDFDPELDSRRQAISEGARRQLAPIEEN